MTRGPASGVAPPVDDQPRPRLRARRCAPPTYQFVRRQCRVTWPCKSNWRTLEEPARRVLLPVMPAPSARGRDVLAAGSKPQNPPRPATAGRTRSPPRSRSFRGFFRIRAMKSSAPISAGKHLGQITRLSDSLAALQRSSAKNHHRPLRDPARVSRSIAGLEHCAPRMKNYQFERRCSPATPRPRPATNKKNRHVAASDNPVRPLPPRGAGQPSRLSTRFIGHQPLLRCTTAWPESSTRTGDLDRRRRRCCASARTRIPVSSFRGAVNPLFPPRD